MTSGERQGFFPDESVMIVYSTANLDKPPYMRITAHAYGF
jgi:hypothetical protein